MILMLISLATKDERVKLLLPRVDSIFRDLLAKKNLLIIVSIVLLVAIVALAYIFLSAPQFLREEHVGGKYQCRIGIIEEDPRGFEVGKLFYVKDGVEYQGYYNTYLRDALDWIRNNTSENAVFLNWWDYGHMIIGYAERESVIKNPSEEALASVGDPSDYKELESHEKIVDVAKAVATTDENELLSTMDKYNAAYLLVTVEDGMGKVVWIFRFAGLNFTDYMNMNWQGSYMTFDPDLYNTVGEQTVIYKLLNGTEIQGVTQVYSDENVRIYKRLT